MTTKRIILTVAGIVLALGLLVLLFVGVVAEIASYSVRHSEAAMKAGSYLRTNKLLKADIGEVKDASAYSMNVNDLNGGETLKVKVVGEKKTVNAWVELEYRSGRNWYVTGARYVDEKGKMVELLNKFGPSSDTDGSENQ